MKESPLFSEKENTPVKAKYVNVHASGRKSIVDCMFGPDENRVYEIDTSSFNTEDLGTELVDEYILLPNGDIVRNNLNFEF